MTDYELKLYNVIVMGGSGCLFQPATNSEFTYILTSRHLFETKEQDERGEEISSPIPDGTSIEITRLVYTAGTFKEEPINFIIQRGSNFFAHRSADACILKVAFIEGFGKIFQDDINSALPNGYKLYGYPEAFRPNRAGKKDTAYEITGFNLPADYSYGAQLQNTTLNRQNVRGMSGGGILKKTETGVAIIGTQTEMANAGFAGGQIYFTPISFYNEIVDNPVFASKLEKLSPPYLHNFSFLRTDSFVLDVDDFIAETITSARTVLLNQAQNIIDSDVTPSGIKELFQEKLLVIESDVECFTSKAIWIAWLEFLTILNIVKYDNINQAMLSDIFKDYRLKYINIKDWTDPKFREHIGNADYTGLKPDSNVFISSPVRPKYTCRIPKGKIIDISKPYDRTGFRTDKGIDPFTSFNFIHLDYFKTKCIIEKVDNYRQLGEEKLLSKLKEEYHELFV
jgi:hypothetical protein